MQETGTFSNAITGLPGMSWRNLDPPAYSTANFSGSPALARRAYPYIRGISHENTGDEAIVMPFTLLFLNGVYSSQSTTASRAIFPELFEEWVAAVVLDPTPGKLLHPYLGELDAVVTSWDVEIVAEKTSGVVMNVTWEKTILDLDEEAIFPGVPVNLHGAAAAADQAMSDLGIEYPTGERTTSLTDMVNQIDSLVFSARLTLEGMINQALGFIANIIETVENVKSHATWALEDMLKQLYDGLKALGIPATKGLNRLVLTMTLEYDDTLDGIAASVKNSVGEIITLNPNLLGSPVVKAGESISYFGDGAYK